MCTTYDEDVVCSKNANKAFSDEEGWKCECWVGYQEVAQSQNQLECQPLPDPCSLEPCVQVSSNVSDPCSPNPCVEGYVPLPSEDFNRCYCVLGEKSSVPDGCSFECLCPEEYYWSVTRSQCVSHKDGPGGAPVKVLEYEYDPCRIDPNIPCSAKDSSCECSCSSGFVLDHTDNICKENNPCDPNPCKDPFCKPEVVGRECDCSTCDYTGPEYYNEDLLLLRELPKYDDTDFEEDEIICGKYWLCPESESGARSQESGVQSKSSGASSGPKYLYLIFLLALTVFG